MNTYKILLLVCASIPFAGYAINTNDYSEYFKTDLPFMHEQCLKASSGSTIEDACILLARYYDRAKRFENEQPHNDTSNYRARLQQLYKKGQHSALNEALKSLIDQEHYLTTDTFTNVGCDSDTAHKLIWAKQFLTKASLAEIILTSKRENEKIELESLNKDAATLDKYFPNL